MDSDQNLFSAPLPLVRLDAFDGARFRELASQGGRGSAEAIAVADTIDTFNRACAEFNDVLPAYLGASGDLGYYHASASNPPSPGLPHTPPNALMVGLPLRAAAAQYGATQEHQRQLSLEHRLTRVLQRAEGILGVAEAGFEAVRHELLVWRKELNGVEQAEHMAAFRQLRRAFDKTEDDLEQNRAVGVGVGDALNEFQERRLRQWRASVSSMPPRR